MSGTDDAAVTAPFQRVHADHGGLDLLVANACNDNALPFRGGPFWTLPLGHAIRHLAASLVDTCERGERRSSCSMT